MRKLNQAVSKIATLEGTITSLIKQIDEMRRLKEDEDPIAVSQQFHGSGPWLVHGANPNRQPKISFESTREDAEAMAEKVRQVIAEATLPLKTQLQEWRAALVEIADLDSDDHIANAQCLAREALGKKPVP